MKWIPLLLVVMGLLGGCCEPHPYQRLYIIAEKVLKKKDMASTDPFDEEVSVKPSKKSIPADPKSP